MHKEAKISHGAVVLPVTDINRSLSWYVGHLGFTCTFKWGEPLNYAILNLEERFSLHLSLTEKENVVNQRTTIYFFVYQIDTFYAALLANPAVEVTVPLAQQDYQMKDFDVRDPDGHVLCFGEGVNE